MRSILEVKNYRGFTLIEVLIALAILAIALAAALRSSNISTDTAIVLRQKTLAGFVASDLLAEASAKRAFPPVGTSNGKAEQAGQTFNWEQIVEGTASQYFRRSKIKVYGEGKPDYVLYEMTGFYANTSVGGRPVGGATTGGATTPTPTPPLGPGGLTN
ncbi:MAG: type II secretion system minor pseudopilin GspI [Burkholderiales bacterium]